MNHDTSPWLRRLRILTLVYVVVLTLLLWLPDPRMLLGGWGPEEGPTRSHAHLIAFAGLGFLVELGRFGKNSVVRALAILLYAVTTEVGQYFIPDRYFQWEDIGQDLLGAVVGIAVAAACRTFTNRIFRE